MADRALSPGEQSLALATKRAVQAAGGLDDCVAEIALAGHALSTTHLSRCCSPNRRDSITIRDAVTIQSRTHGRDGHPHILHAMARQLGAIVVLLPEDLGDPDRLACCVLDLATELGDVSRGVGAALAGAGTGGRAVTPAEAEQVLDQLDQHDAASARLRHALTPIARREKPG